jgi:hypothetical protein
MTIDPHTYELTKNNFYQKEFQKTQIVIGHNNRKDMRHFDSWINRRGGIYKKTSTYSIDTNGLIYQHYNPKYYSDFLGLEQDKNIISITLVNQGWVKLTENNVFVDWLGHIYSRDIKPYEKNWRGYTHWVKYTDKQFESLKWIIKHLIKEFNLSENIIDHNVFDENIDIFKGVVFRSNYFKNLTDVSPAFDINKIK